VGGYDDWLRQRSQVKEASKATPKEAKTKKEKQPKEKSKLSFKETRELEELPLKIEKMEKEKTELMELLNSADLYKTSNQARVLDLNTRLAALDADLEIAYSRWDKLEEMASKFSTEKT
jgi:ABC transport system ATP-binding/permease protein